MRCEQMMSLRSNVRDPQHHVLGELSFHGQVVLLRILRLQMRSEFSKEQKRTERGPINAAVGPSRRIHSTRSARCLVNHTSKRIRAHRTGLREIGQVEQWARNERAPSKRRLRAELLQNQLLDRIIKNSPPGANARFTGAAE